MRFVTTLLRDITGLAGLGCLTYAAYLTSAQLAFAVGGALLCLVAVLTALGGEK